MLAASFVVMAPLSVTEALAGESNPVSFSYRSGLIWLKARINGQTRELNFLLDSGAEQSVIDTRTARKHGIRFVGSETVMTVHGNESAYQTAPVSVGLQQGAAWAAPMLALGLSTESRAVGRRIDGLLGVDFMKERAVQIDYQTGTLRFEAHATGRSDFSIPITLHRGIPCVRLRVDDSVVLPLVRLDTGCAQALHWSPATAGMDPNSANREIGLALSRSRSRQSNVRIGPALLQNLRTTIHPRPIFPGEQGLLGNPLLAQFGTVTIDFRRRKLFLKAW